MTNMIKYSGLRTDLYDNPNLLAKIAFAIASSPISKELEYGKVYVEDPDDEEEESPYWGVKHIPSDRELAIFYDDEAHVFADCPAWRIFINEILDIMDEYSIAQGFGPVRRDENF
jgi:hypothetical protein